MLLCIDTALAGLSVALCDGDTVIAEHHALIGRGHAEAVIPVVAQVLQQADIAAPAAIVVDIGPGSFTGLRIGIAAARALGLAWGIPVHGMRATALVAADAFARAPACAALVVVLDAGRGQLYVERFERGGLAGAGEILALSPADARAFCGGGAVAGPAAPLISSAQMVHADWPQAANARRLPVAARRLVPAPLYVRAPDVQRAAPAAIPAPAS